MDETPTTVVVTETPATSPVPTTPEAIADTLRIKDDLIEKYKAQINDLNIRIAYLENDNHDKDIELSRTKALLDVAVAPRENEDEDGINDSFVDTEKLAETIQALV